jgi:hypothetical protein
VTDWEPVLEEISVIKVPTIKPVKQKQIGEHKNDAAGDA